MWSYRGAQGNIPNEGAHHGHPEDGPREAGGMSGGKVGGGFGGFGRKLHSKRHGKSKVRPVPHRWLPQDSLANVAMGSPSAGECFRDKSPASRETETI